jgi:hypothetical protein
MLKIFNKRICVMGKLLSAVRLLGFTTAALIAMPGHAELITFDDIVRVPGDDCFCDHPLTNEYETRGLVIDNGYLVDGITGDGNGGGVTAPNALLGGDTLELYFVGKKPTYVEMYVSAAFDQAIFIDIFGDSGLLFSRKTDGYAGDDNYVYKDNQLVKLFSAEGISHISMSGYYNLRTSALIDDLCYKYDVVEPNALFLLLGTLGFVALRRRNLGAI